MPRYRSKGHPLVRFRKGREVAIPGRMEATPGTKSPQSDRANCRPQQLLRCARTLAWDWGAVHKLYCKARIGRRRIFRIPVLDGDGIYCFQSEVTPAFDHDECRRSVYCGGVYWGHVTLAAISHTDRFHPTARWSDREEGWSFGLGVVFSLGLALAWRSFQDRSRIFRMAPPGRLSADVKKCPR